MLEVQDGEQLVLWLHSTTQTMQVSVLSAEQAAEQAATPDAMQEDTEEYCVVAASADPPPSPGALPAAEPVLPPAPCWRAAQAMMQERRRSGEAPETWRRWCAALRCLLHRLQLDSPSLRYPSDHSSSGGGGAPVLDRCSPLAKGVVFSSQMVDVAMRLNGVELTKAVSVATVPAHFPPSWHAVASGEVPAGAAEQHLGPVPESPPLHPQGAGWPHEEAYRSLSAPTMRSLDRGDSAPAAADAAAATAPAAPAGPMPEVACSLEEVRCRGRCTLLGPADAEQLRQLLTMPVAEVAALAQRLGRPGASYAATATGQGKLLLASSASSPAERRSRSVVHRWAAAEGGAAAALPVAGELHLQRGAAGRVGLREDEGELREPAGALQRLVRQPAPPLEREGGGGAAGGTDGHPVELDHHAAVGAGGEGGRAARRPAGVVEAALRRRSGPHRLALDQDVSIAVVEADGLRHRQRRRRRQRQRRPQRGPCRGAAARRAAQGLARLVAPPLALVHHLGAGGVGVLQNVLRRAVRRLRLEEVEAHRDRRAGRLVGETDGQLERDGGHAARAHRDLGGHRRGGAGLGGGAGQRRHREDGREGIGPVVRRGAASVSAPTASS